MRDKIKQWLSDTANLENEAEAFSTKIEDRIDLDLTGMIEQCFNDLQEKPMYESLEEYEQILGYKVNESCRTGFNMARLKLPPDETVN